MPRTRSKFRPLLHAMGEIDSENDDQEDHPDAPEEDEQWMSQPDSEACRGWSCFSHNFPPEIVKAAALPWAAAADCERVQRLAGGREKRMMYYPSQIAYSGRCGHLIPFDVGT